MLDLVESKSYTSNSTNKNKLPGWVIYLTLFLCFSPFILTLFGVSFSTRTEALNLQWTQDTSKHELVEAMFYSLRGAFTHTLMEWTAFCIAVFVALLSFSHYRVNKDVATPIIGVAFFMAGCMDGFHTLAADRLIEAVADNRDLVPFTWAICRMFNALILMMGVIILLKRSQVNHSKPGIQFVLIISLSFGVIAYAIIHYLATTSNLPQTTFPDALLTRPYDVVPLVLFVICGIFIFPLLFKRYPSLFAHALIISIIPQVVTQVHITFGSTALFDNHFNIGHYTKVVAYLVPLIGLFLDYVRVQQGLKDSEDKQRAILETMVDGLITINDKGTIQSCNKAAEHLFGYRAEEMIGFNVNKLMPEPYHSEHDGYLTRYKQTGEAHIIGIGREVEGLRKDESTFPLELSVSKMEVNGKQMFTGVVRDITERKKLDRMKSEFISTVSHELRTPLTSIRGALGLILGKSADQLPDKARNMLEMANRNSERLTLLINDLLDLEKIESGSLEFEFKPVDLIVLAQRALEDNAGYASKHDVNLVFDSELQQAQIRADDHRLLQVFANLISNAVKYSPANDKVEISVKPRGNTYRVYVRDHGSGIPEEFRDRMFKRFAQADSSDTREKGGTGLGLSISKAIVEHHDGEIGYESEVGKGTVFYFELPELHETIETKNVATSANRVLICEDNPDVASILREMLEPLGVVTDVAASGEATRNLLEKNNYRLLLLDLTLPDIDGLDLLREIREKPETEELPVIVVSGRAQEGKIEFNGEAVTVVDWIQKPIEQDRLQRALRDALSRAERPHILHVEDDPDIVQVTKVLFEDEADLTYVASVNEAREILQQQNFDLVILDLNLPDGSGVELLDQLKDYCPVVIFSAANPAREITEQVTVALTKASTSNEQLLNTIKKILNG